MGKIQDLVQRKPEAMKDDPCGIGVALATKLATVVSNPPYPSTVKLPLEATTLDTNNPILPATLYLKSPRA